MASRLRTDVSGGWDCALVEACWVEALDTGPAVLHPLPTAATSGGPRSQDWSDAEGSLPTPLRAVCVYWGRGESMCVTCVGVCCPQDVCISIGMCGMCEYVLVWVWCGGCQVCCRCGVGVCWVGCVCGVGVGWMCCICDVCVLGVWVCVGVGVCWVCWCVCVRCVVYVVCVCRWVVYVVCVLVWV